MTAKQSGLRGKVRDGTVVSDKMQKTVVVAIAANFRHRLYKKSVRRVRRLLAHDEHEEARLGDRVRIIESRPISARKRWRLLEVLTRAELPEVAPESIDLELLGEVKREEPEAEAPETAAEEEPVPAEAASSPEAEAVVPESVEVEAAEEVPEIEAVEEETPAEEPEPDVEAPAEEETPAEGEAPAEEPPEAKPEEESPDAEEAPEEEKPS